MLIERINPESIFKPVGNYSQLVKVKLPGAQLLYVAGQVALDKELNIVGSTIKEQADMVFKNIRTILESENGTLDNVVKITIFITDMSKRPDLGEILTKYFPKNPPASTLVEVKSLARPEFLIEIEATAVVG
ncbi:MAG: RidA family protein [Candidatus Hodarchaeales archaeon]|jgi:reactive intermediate/imine deaminase